MRTDEGTLYNLPGLLLDHQGKDQAKYWKKGITFDLKGLPMIHDNGVQTGVGARGWYNSAVLSAMMLLVLLSKDDADANDNVETNTTCSMRDLLQQDMMQLLQQQDSLEKKNPTVLEIGAGAIGLVGMTMAWILSHKQQLLDDDDDVTAEEKLDIADNNSIDNMQESKIILTDNDLECLAQLQCNAHSVLQSLLEFNSGMTVGSGSGSGGNDDDESKHEESDHPSANIMSILSDDAIPFLSLPNIQTKVLDWDDHAIDQEVLDSNQIDFVVGAELAYHQNNCCAMQVAKILELHPKAVIWIVQLPRNGWFQVFQRELQAALPNICIQKMDPVEIDSKVHQMAESIMPMPVVMRLNDIKAVRISLQAVAAAAPPKSSSTKSSTSRTSFDLGAQIEQAKRLSQQLNSTQEFSLDSHWEIG